ncbi:MAG TPA: 2-oxo acid dehydrogenase subunit E2 [Sphaerochaeta sp.]|nr:2-oxo acid dehydrogenase subunit E2 [Sphaerochaeta sp.]
MSRRNDARRVYDIPPYKQIFPYIMPRRCDSLVYQHLTFDMTNAVTFIKEQKAEEGKTYRVFEVFLAAMLRTIALRPHLNRFIANYRYWERDELSLNFVVRESSADDAPEHSMPLYFQPDMTLEEIASIITGAIDQQRQPESDTFTDEAIRFFLRFPSPVIRLIVAFARFLDRFGIAPKALREADGLHTSLFVSNLGSIGIGGHTPLHHLYEWGTTSIFLTIGQLRRTRLSPADGGGTKDTLEIGVTIDERITDGYYLVKSMRVLQEHLLNPELLLDRPTLPAPPLTRREYRKRLRALR